MVGHSLQLAWTMFVSVLWLLLDLGKFLKSSDSLSIVCHCVVFTVSVTNETHGELKCYARINHSL